MFVFFVFTIMKYLLDFTFSSNKSKTLCIESSFNIEHLALSPNNSTLVAVNEKGDASLISMISQSVIHTHRFNRPVNFITFTPDGMHLIVAKESTVFVFKGMLCFLLFKL